MTESLLSDSLVNHFKFIYNINLWEKIICGLQLRNGTITHTCRETNDYRRHVLVIYAT